jgi:Alg9-like mannosyltransferase family
MTLLKWVWAEDNERNVDPEAIYYAVRAVMFILSFVLEDWAIHELVHSPRHRRQAAILVASSYVTWTYQSHTFSNSVETLLVAWSLVLIERIVLEKVSLEQVSLFCPALIIRRTDHQFFLAPFCLSLLFSAFSTGLPFLLS